jgi:hypothetical protein
MNWGNRLLFTFLVFGGGMGYLVYRSLNTDFELVEKDYYKSELRYQDIIDGTNRANSLSGQVVLTQTERGILVQLPDEMKGKKITGSVLFYCAYDAARDRKFSLGSMTKASQLIGNGLISPGNYTVKINWSAEGKDYYSEKTIVIT